MKRLLACAVVLFIFFATFAEPVQAVVSGDSSGNWPGEVDQRWTEPFDYEFLEPSVQWTDWVADQVPVTFSENNIQYELADSVLQVDSQVTDQLATAEQLLSGATAPRLRPNKIVGEGGYVPKAFLDQVAQSKGRQIENGTIVVDQSTGTAFKVVSPSVFTGAFAADETLGEMIKPLENTYSVARPQLHEVIKDFELKEETIRLTRGNISGFAPNIEKNLVLPGLATPQAFGDSLKDFKYLSDDPMIKLQFTDQILDANLGDGKKIQVNVSGGLGIEDIDLTGRYSGFDGYRIALTLKQESYLVIEMEAEVNSEVRIPILGLDIPFGIGRISGGIFAIVGMDGTLRLEIEARDYTETTLGVRGGTKFYIPTSVKPIFDQKFTSDGEVDLNGDIDGYLKFGPMMGLELFGFDLVGAGVFLGAGVQVQADQKMLDVHLYGLFNVYVKLAGEHYNLANYRPTILRRRQANTAGFRIKVLEAYVLPGRVGGIIEREGSQLLSFEPASGISYRILVVPSGVPFDPNDAAAPDHPEIRKYPASGYATTNGEGEFIQEDEQMLYGKDQAIVEFMHEGVPYFSNPVSPTLPFQDFTVTAADYFNDYVTGQVNPIRVINWDAPADAPPEDQYEWTYCTGGLITVNPYLSHNYNTHVPTGDQALTITDEFGNFDTRKPVVSLVTGQPITNDGFDVFETPESWGNRGGFDLAIDYHEAVRTGRVSYRTTMAMSFSRTIEMVPDSFQSYEEDGKIINQVQFDESVWIVNPNGTRIPNSNEFRFNRIVFSTQDYYLTDIDYSKQPDYVRNAQYIFGETGKILTPLLDSQGQETGAALFQERVTVEWVWQDHPNPVTITSLDHTTVNQQGGTFQVTATGIKPFKFSLLGPPAGVKIGTANGQIQIPANLAPGEYIFTIRVEENRSNAMLVLNLDDPYEGHDPSPPDEQIFTLTVSQEPGIRETTTNETSATQNPSETTQKPTETTQEPTRPTEPERTAPTIKDADHDYEFTKFINSGDYQVQIEASGSQPISWSLEKKSDRYLIPEGVSIDAETGLLTIRDGIDSGTSYFVIRASNDVGSDTQDCVLKVVELVRPTLPPVIQPTLPPILPSLPRMASGLQRLAIGGKDESIQLPYVKSPELNVADQDQPASQIPDIPPNSATIRYDDPKDVFTEDRNFLDGTAFVHWHASPGVMLDDYAGTGIMIIDEAPRCDNYHYIGPGAVPAGMRDKIIQSIKEEAASLSQGDVFLGETFNREALIESIDQLVTNPLEDTGFLEYGSMLKDLDVSKGGQFQIDLNEDTGTFVTGKYFQSLQDNPKATLTFSQPGATLAFTGATVETDADVALMLYNFAFSAGASHQTEILAAAALKDGAGDSFVFSFGHHGTLPGVGTFSIDTGLAEGQRVNVYRYEADAATAGGPADFTLIAGDLTVGANGVVSYQNNTMSEYLVTTKRLDGAQISEMATRQNSSKKRTNPLVWWGIGIAALLAVGVGLKRVKLPQRKIS